MNATQDQLERLGAYLSEVGVAPPATTLALERLTGGRSNLTYRLYAGEREMVLRRPPATGAHASAHDVLREWQVTSALYATGFPVPAPIHFCDDVSVLDAPFSLTEFVEGPVLRKREDLDRQSDESLTITAHVMTRTLAQLHSLDPIEVGLGEFGKPNGYVERQLGLWRRQWDVIKSEESPGFERLHDLLVERIPAAMRTSIVHGDYRVDNVILGSYEGDSIRAVLDWELSTLGDPLADVGMLCAYRHSALDDILGFSAAWSSPRFPSPEALIELYVRESPWAAPSDWAFYLGFAYFKIAAISQGIAYRALKGVDADGTGGAAAEAVPMLVAAGLDLIRA